MKNKYMIRIFFIAATMLSVISCNRYLDIKPYGETIPETAEEFSALLHDLIEEIDYGEDVIIGDAGTMVQLECYADNLATNLTSYPTGNLLHLYVGSYLSNKQLRYSDLYKHIRTCNIIIDNLEERDNREGKDVLGTAYAVRGICYYNLLRDFCQSPGDGMTSIPGMPLVTTFDMEARPTRSSYMQTVGQIESDLLTAIDYDIQNTIYRFNSDVAKGYLARLYFWTQQYGLAAQYASELLEKYPLLEAASYKEMMESVVAKKGNMLLKSEILSETGQSTNNNTLREMLKSRPCTRQFYDLFTEKERDIRFGLSIDKKRQSVKYPFACLRSAEMQLILAESYYLDDEPGKALAALNELRRKRIVDVPDYTEQTLPAVDPNDLIQIDAKGNTLAPLLYAIHCERRKELFLEGDRWYELKRNGCPEFWVAKQGVKYTTYSWMYTFPIHIKDIQMIEGMEQNPGYDKME